MHYSQKYTLAAFFQPIEVGTEFPMTDWPLHITLADVFAVNLSVDIVEKLAGLFANQSPINLTADDDATLGTTKVVLIRKNDELQQLHDQIIDVLELHNATFNTPEFTRAGFLPHATIQKSGRVSRGDTIHLTTVSLVDMFPGGNWQQRKILKKFQIQH